jgi:hypothetical protein
VAVVAAAVVDGGAAVARVGGGCQPPRTTTCGGGEGVAEADAAAVLVAAVVAALAVAVAVPVAVAGGCSTVGACNVAAVPVPCDGVGDPPPLPDTARKMAPPAASMPSGTSHSAQRRGSGCASAPDTDVGDAPVDSGPEVPWSCAARAAPD